MVRRLRGKADRINRADRAGRVDRANKTDIGRFFQPIYNHQ